MMDLPWFPMDARRWLVGTAGMTKPEKGVFIDLLCYQWVNGPLSSIPSRLPIECADEWEYLKGKFIDNGGGTIVNRKLHNIRLEKESIINKQSEGGKKGARIRYGSPSELPINTPTHILDKELEIEEEEPEKKKSAATEVPALYHRMAEGFLLKQKDAFPRESAWKQFDSRVIEGGKNLYLFHTQNDWTEKEISALLDWILVDDFWSKQIRTLGGIRQKKKGGAMKFENAKAASGDVKDDIGARNEREAIEQHERLKREDAEAAPIGEFKEMVQDVAKSLRG